MSKTFKIVLAVILVAVLGIGLYFLITTKYKNDREISATEFEERIIHGENFSENERITVIRVENYTVYGYANEDASNYNCWANMFSLYGSEAWTGVLAEWKASGVEIWYADPEAGAGWGNFIYIAVLVVGVVAFFLVLRATSGGGGKVMNFGKTKAKVSTNLKVRFSDVAGAEEEKVELAEVVEFLKTPKKFSNLGARIPKGVLLVGPPGTGKTLFAKAVAGEAGVPFFSVSGSDFVEMYVGVGASRVRDLFDMAKRNQPCIIFIDEIDAVGRQRGAGLGGGNDEREQTLNQILVQMDGFDSNEGVIVMAATNRADILDSALLRPGRFDRQIYVHMPDVKGREQILKVHARNKPLAPDVNFKTIARMTSGFSGADLANLLNEAAILAARLGKNSIGNLELYEGINKVIMGPQKKSRVVTEEEKRLTAYHESGHAILGKLCHERDNVQEVTIIPRGAAGGYTLYRPETDNNLETYEYALAHICSALGGRVAEELVIHDVSSGASGDIRQVTAIARKMVMEWGMSQKLGPIAYSSDGPVFIGRDFEERATYSEETASAIDEEVKRIVAEQYERARKLLTEHRSILDNMAHVLVERETIYTAEVDMLMRGASWEEVVAYMEEHDKDAPDDPFAVIRGGDSAPKSVQTSTDQPNEADSKQADNTEPANSGEPGTDDSNNKNE